MVRQTVSSDTTKSEMPYICIRHFTSLALNGITQADVCEKNLSSKTWT